MGVLASGPLPRADVHGSAGPHPRKLRAKEGLDDFVQSHLGDGIERRASFADDFRKALSEGLGGVSLDPDFHGCRLRGVNRREFLQDLVSDIRIFVASVGTCRGAGCEVER